MSSNHPTWYSALIADKKRLSMVLGLLAIGLLLWGRLLIRDLPKTAVADPTAAVVASLDGAADSPKRTATPGRITVAATLPDSPGRDLFALAEGAFERVRKPVVETPAVEAKSPPKPVDVVDEAALVRQAAKGLVLQSTVFGESPTALISGELISPGQTIRGFTLKKIEQRQVVLEKNGIEVRLEM